METIHLKDAATKVLQDIEVRVQQGGIPFVGMPTGFHKLDEATGGLRKKAFYVLGGRTGVGKSALALTMSNNVSDNKKNVLYGSFEMSAELLVLRILSGMTGVPTKDIERGRLTKEQQQAVWAAYETFGEKSIHIFDNTCTSKQFMLMAAQLQQTLGQLDLVVADYLSLFMDPGDSEVQRLEGIVGRISAATTNLDTTTLGVVQLNRESETQEGGRPTLRNIRYSDRISHDASGAFFVHRPYLAEMRTGAEPLLKEEAEIILDKNRHGEVGSLSCYFYPKEMRWEDTKEAIVNPPLVGSRK